MESVERTAAEKRALMTILVEDILAEAIRDLGQVPSGHLYANICGRVDLEMYQVVIASLKKKNLVSERAHLLTWIGPKGEAR